jgi:hypothetical protein
MLAFAGAALTGACATSAVDPGLGEAVKYDMAIQTINPDPVYPPEATQPGSNGALGAGAASRYRLGTVKPLEREATSTGSTGPK